MSSLQNGKRPFVWSPMAPLQPFNPQLTPMYFVPITPLACSPLPIFTFSTNMAMHAMQSPAPPPAGAISISTVPQGPKRFDAATPLLMPAPGSKERAQRRQKRTALKIPPIHSPALVEVSTEDSAATTNTSLEHEPKGKSLEHALQDEVGIVSSVTLISSGPSSGSDESTISMVSPREPDELYPPSPEEYPSESSPESDQNDKDDKSYRIRMPMAKREPKHVQDLEPEWMVPQKVTDGFKCISCEKTFKFRKHCRRHMRSHTGIKDFACHKCGARFTRKDTCVRHTLLNCKAKAPKNTSLTSRE